MIADTYLDSKFYCHLSGSQISIILYQLELIPQEKDHQRSTITIRSW